MVHYSVALPCHRFNQAKYFAVAVVAVDQEHGTVPFAVEASFGHGSSASMDLGQTTAATCTNLTYTLYSQNNTENLSLAAVGKCPYFSENLLLNIRLSGCPKGFELSHNPAQCVCQERLLEYTHKSTIDKQKIHHTTNFWLGYDNTTRGLVLHPHCPFN